MRTLFEQFLNVLWFLGVWALYFLICHLIARWGVRWGVAYRKVLLFSIVAPPFAALWIFLRSYRIRNTQR